MVASFGLSHAISSLQSGARAYKDAWRDLSKSALDTFVEGFDEQAFFGANAPSWMRDQPTMHVLKGLEKLGLFGPTNPQTRARKALKKHFEEMFDVNELFLVIDGRLTQVEELAIDRFTGFLDQLDTSSATGAAQFAGFQGIGAALAEIFNLDDYIPAQQIGDILANTVGGSLNNLQILMQSAGVSAEEMGAALEEAFLNGDVRAGEFLMAMGAIDSVMQQGIPDGIGMITMALDNLIQGAGNGRLSMDALGDLAVEAGEAGVTSLAGLQDALVAAGGDADSVAQLFQAIASAGITTLDQLANISISSTAQVVAQLENIDFFATNSADKVEELQKQLDGLTDKEVNLKFNITTTTDESTEEYSEAIKSNYSTGGFGLA